MTARRRAGGRAAALALLAAAALLAPGRAAACRLALALAMDISASVDSIEYEIQRGGLVAALADPELREALLSQEGEVWLTVYEWSGWQQQDVVLPWMRLAAPQDIDRAAAAMAAHQRPYRSLSTAIGEALRFGARRFDHLPERCARQVIDVSGDGASNQATPPAEVRRSGILSDITVNGLAIRGASPDPAEFYAREVIHGPEAFLMEATGGFVDFPAVLLRKLLREVRRPMILGRATR